MKKPQEIRQRGPNPKIARMSGDEIRKEFVRPVKFLARERSPEIVFINYKNKAKK